MAALRNLLLLSIISATLRKSFGNDHGFKSKPKPLRVAVNIIPPFTILNNHRPTKAKYRFVPKSQITGFETEIFDILLEALNIKAKYYARIHNEDMYQGTVFENGTATGMFHDLQIGRFDAVIGYIKDIPHLSTFFELSVNWYYDELLYCMPKTYVNCQWMIIWNMLSPVLPLIIFVWIMQQLFIYWWLRRRCPTFGNILVIILKLFSGNAAKIPRARHPRLAASLWIMFQAFFTVIIQSVWTLLLSNPKTGYILVPTTLSNLFEGNYKLFYNPYYGQYFLNHRARALNNSQYCFGFQECVNAADQEENSFTVLSNTLIQYRFADRNTPEFVENWRCFTEEHIKSGNFFVYQKNNSLANLINRQFLSLLGRGVNLAQVIKFTKPNTEVPKIIIGRVIGLKYLRPSFYFLLLGLACSFCCFIIECVVYRIKNK